MTPREDRLTNILWEKCDYNTTSPVGGKRRTRKASESSPRQDEDAPLLRRKLEEKIEELRQLKKREKTLSHHLRETRSGELYLASSQTTTAAARALRTEIAGLRNEAEGLRHILSEALEQESYWQGKATQPSSDEQYYGDPQERRRVHSAVTSALRVLQCLVHVALPRHNELLPPEDKCKTSQEVLASRLLHSEAAIDAMFQRYVRGAVCEDQMLDAVQDSIPLPPTAEPNFAETLHPSQLSARRNDFSHPAWAMVTGQQDSAPLQQSPRELQDQYEVGQWPSSRGDHHQQTRPEHLDHVYNDLIYGDMDQMLSPRSPNGVAGYGQLSQDPYASKTSRSGRGTPEAFLKSLDARGVMGSAGLVQNPRMKGSRTTDGRHERLISKGGPYRSVTR